MRTSTKQYRYKNSHLKKKQRASLALQIEALEARQLLATNVLLGSVDQFTGPDDLTLDPATVQYAVNFSADSPDVTVNGVTFLHDRQAIAGASFTGPNEVSPWPNTPDYGTSPDDTALEEVMSDIRWANGPSQTLNANLDVTAGTNYRLQLLVSGNRPENRNWDISVDGRAAVDSIRSLGVNPGETYSANRSMVYTYDFTAPDNQVNVVMGTLFGVNDGGDDNPIWQGLTLHELTYDLTATDDANPSFATREDLILTTDIADSVLKNDDAGSQSYGSPLVARVSRDGANGFVFTSLDPIMLNGNVESWSFYSDGGGGRQVTPILVEEVAGDMIVRGIGTSRLNAASGLQSFDFGVVEGSAAVTNGNFHIAWKDGTDGTNNPGVIDYVSSGSINGVRWFGTRTSFNPGDIYSGGGAGARDYSIQFHVVKPINVDSADAVSAQGAAVSVNADGTFTYDPTQSQDLRNLKFGESATDTFTYAVSDGVLQTTNANGRFVRVENNGGSNRRMDIGNIEVFAPGATPGNLGSNSTIDLAFSGNGASLFEKGAASGFSQPHGTNDDPNLINSAETGGGATWSSQGVGNYVIIDLGTSFDVGSVRLHQRSDCCWGRLENFSVTLLQDDGSGNPGASVQSNSFPGRPANNGFGDLAMAQVTVPRTEEATVSVVVTGSPPSATDDPSVFPNANYTTDETALLNVSAANGVLINDVTVDGTFGDPLINRPSTDGANGFVFTALDPLTIEGTVDAWSYFSNGGNGRSVTPVLLEDVGGNFLVRGVGTSRVNNASGIQSYPFGLASGSADITNSNFHIAWKDGTNGTNNPGVIDYVGSGSAEGVRWFNTRTTLPIGGSFGGGTFGGRDYSIEFHVDNPFTVVDFDATSTSGAAVSVNADGSFSYNPAGSAELDALDTADSATDTFSYTVTDGVLELAPPVGRFVRVVNNGPTTRMDIGEIEAFAANITPGDLGTNTAIDLAFSGNGATVHSKGAASGFGQPHGTNDDPRLIDGIETTGGNTWSSTGTESFVVIDLGSDQEVKTVRVHQREDCCWDRLNNFRVELLADDGSGNPGAIVQSGTFPTRPADRGFGEIVLGDVGSPRRESGTVSVLVNGVNDAPVANDDSYDSDEDTVLSVPAVTPTVNLALAGTATQSNTSSGGVPSRAIDGNTNGTWGVGSTTHTNNNSFNWWQVQLPEVSNIEDIMLFNRADCCGSRLAQVRVSVFDGNPGAGGTEVFFFNHPGQVAQGGSLSIDVGALQPGVMGDYIRVAIDPTSAAGDAGMEGNGRNPAGGIVSLAEVQVVGHTAPGLLGNDTDVEEDDLSVSAFDNLSANGATISANGDGSFTYDPINATAIQALDEGAMLSDTFDYTIVDGLVNPADTNTGNAGTILGTGNGSLLGGDLTDPENNGAADSNTNYDANFFASVEPNFGGGEFAFNVFDNRTGGGNDKWCCENPPEWVAAEFSQPYQLTHFTITSGNDSDVRRPDVWEIQGSNDSTNGGNGTWATVYSYNNDGAAPFTANSQTILYTSTQGRTDLTAGNAHFETGGLGYQWFRYTVSSTQGNTIHQLGELEFFGTTPQSVLSGTGTATVEIVGINDAPVAVTDSVSISEGVDAVASTPATGDLLANDTDVDDANASLTANAATLTGNYGTLDILADGSYTYTLNDADYAVNSLDQGDSLTEMFTYTVNDNHAAGNAKSDTGTVAVTITGSNDSPDPVDDMYSADEDNTLVVAATTATSNLALAGTATQSTTAAGGVPSRAIDGNTNGNYGAGSTTHTNNSAFSWWQVQLPAVSNIEDIMLFNRADCCGSRLAQFRVSVFNGDPGAGGNEIFSFNHSGQVAQGGSLSIDVDALQPGVMGDYIRVAIDPASAAGDAGMDGNGLNSAGGIVSLAEVQVIGNVSTGVLSGDSDVDRDVISVSAFDNMSVSGATVSVAADGGFSYDPTGSMTLQALAEGLTLDDTFTYTIVDGITLAADTNTGTAGTILGTGNGSLLGGDLTDPENDGAADANTNYNANFFASNDPNFGGGEFAFNVFDNRTGGGNDKWCCANATQWVAAEFDQAYELTHFTITSGNDAGQRQPDVWEIQGSNDSTNGGNGSWTTIYSYSNPGNAPFTTNSQTLLYTSSAGRTDLTGGASQYETGAQDFSWFRYVVNSTENNGIHQLGELEFFGNEPQLVGSDSATVTIEVTGVNDVPVITDAGANQTVDEGDTVTLDPATFTDVDTADTHSAEILWGDGSAAVAGTVDQVAHTVASSHVYGDNGTYIVTVRVWDNTMAGTGGTAGTDFIEDTFTVTVDNVPPVGVADSYTVDEDVVLSAVAGDMTTPGLVDNDTDAGSDDVLSAREINSSASLTGTSMLGAVVVIQANGSFTYNPQQAAALQVLSNGESVDDSFTYTVQDDDGATDTATVTITVTSTDSIEINTNHDFVFQPAAAPPAIATPTTPGGDLVADTIQVDISGATLQVLVNGSLLRTSMATSAAIDVVGSAANDNVVLNGLGGGAIDIQLAGGTNSLTIDDSADSSDDADIDVTTTGITGLIDGGAAVTYTGLNSLDVTLGNGNNAIDLNLATSGSITTIDVMGGSGEDRFEMTTNQVTTINVHGQSPTILPGDTLVVNTNNVIAPIVFPGTTDGAFVSGGTMGANMDITWTGIDSFIFDNQPFVAGDLYAETTGLNDRLIFSNAGGNRTLARINNVFYGPFAITGKIVAYGQAGNDAMTISGNLLVDVEFHGGPGQDYIAGGVGDDTLFGEAGNDRILVGEGDNTGYGGSGNDQLAGRSGSDTLVGQDGNDALQGGSGSDVLIGDDLDDVNASGNDELVGGNGNDLLVGGPSNDSLAGGFGNDVLIGNDGNDFLRGNQGEDLIIAGNGDDRVYGESNIDRLADGPAANEAIEASLLALLVEWNGPLTGLDRPYTNAGMLSSDTDADILSGGGSGDAIMFGAEDGSPLASNDVSF
jgi:VCBS repeat-containing protein